MNDRIVSLGEVTDILSGFAFNSKHFNKSEGMPVIRIRDVVRGYSDTKYDGAFASEFVVSNGDLLIGMDGEFNIASWSGGDALLNQRVCRISTKNSAVLDERYLLHFLPKELKQIEDKTPFVTVKHLSVKSIRSIQVPLPPISVQRRIADTLDKADALRRKDQELLQKYDELAQSIFYEMFGDPSDNEKGWKKLTIRDLVREVKYGTSSPASEQGVFPYLRMNNITYGGELNLRDLKRIDVSEADYRKYGVQMGDLLFNRTNSKELVGKTTVVDVEQPMVAAGYLIRVRCNELANPYFISAYLNSKVGKSILFNMCKSIIGMANINAQELQNIPIIAPPKELQDAFADKLLAVKGLKSVAIKNTELSEALFASQLQHYF